MKKTLALLLALLLALSALSACATGAAVSADSDQTPADANGRKDAAADVSGQKPDPDPTEPTDPADPAELAEPAQPAGVSALVSYDELYDRLEPVLFGDRNVSSLATGTAFEAEVASEAPAMAEGAAAADNADAVVDAASEPDYSDTNVQVEGIDEGDLVKTDGEYIYILHDSRLAVIRAAGTASEQLADMEVCASDDSDDGYYIGEWANEMYLSGDRLAVLYEHYEWGYDAATEAYTDISYEGVRIYDVSDPSAPRLVADVGQDGYLADSRMAGGVLYLVSSYYVYSGIDRDDPHTFVPCTYRGGAAELMPADCIYLPIEIDSTGYVVVQAIDVATGESLSALSVLGSGGYVYMNANSLYLGSTTYEAERGEPYTDGSYTVTEVHERRETNLIRFAVDGGSVTLAATGSVPGTPLSQYSFDEYGGYLRMVVTVYDSSYRTFEDEAHGWTNYEWGESGTSASLYVLDDSLQVVGSVTDLGEDERVYSVRFDGPVGYFVTFRETDPLFAVDLSDPSAPTVMSALKIPGFSEYLHVWSDGLLFGLGQQADAETGLTEGLKLSMFDVSDPFQVTELYTQTLEFDTSTAEYDAHAICIDPEKNLIGFAAADYNSDHGEFYVLYQYDGGAFTEIARCALNDWIYNVRGLYIGTAFYIVSDSELIVLSLETGAELCRLPLAYG